MSTTETSTGRRRWPLWLLAAPAAVAIWSGWVGLGQMAGFGLVHPLPGIADRWTLNSAITLPIGVEAYSAYALGAWLSARPITATARRFAAYSSLGALTLGLAGQVIYHLLTARHDISAPVAVVVFVACLPVLVLGAGAALHHLLADIPTHTPAPEQAPPVTAEQTAPEQTAPELTMRAPYGGQATTGEPATASGPVPARRATARAKRPPKTPRSRPRRLLADYLAQARGELAAGVEPTPAWCRRVTGCSAGTSVKLAAALREQAPPPRVTGTSSTDDAEAHAGPGADHKERAA